MSDEGIPSWATLDAASGESPGPARAYMSRATIGDARNRSRWISEDILLIDLGIDFGQSVFATQPPSKGVGALD